VTAIREPGVVVARRVDAGRRQPREIVLEQVALSRSPLPWNQ